ncbi:MAG: phosphatidate cytidylyltransferase [Bacteroidetes bacterium]|nr:phosphatidate cytidylyltransferase [Bacteroidota bacterium]MBS1756474.1 phosphatidate cytidylyltransferase [Bacteroidota bacterium]
MAINISTLKTRSLTAVIFVVVMLAGLFINQWGFIALFLIIMFGCLYELSKILKKISVKKYFLIIPLALFYIIMPCMMMLDLGLNGSGKALETNVYSPLYPCAIIFSIWINDTMAYLSGSFIGKTPFSKISPKKTWEGTAGGALLCVVVISLLGYFIPIAKQVPFIHWLAIAALCAVFGTLGDLFESKLKRLANIKDSGNFMPGHGGFLDRFDSMLFATPLVWCYVKLFL